MHTLRFLILSGIVLGLNCTANARLAETFDQLCIRYGLPTGGALFNDHVFVKIVPSEGEKAKLVVLDVDNPTSRDNPDPTQIETAKFEKDDFKITIHFIQGKSVSERYERKTRLFKRDQWRLTRAWNLSNWVEFPNESASQRQNEFKDLAVLTLL